jgi:hypothetical protein
VSRFQNAADAATVAVRAGNDNHIYQEMMQ